jgi:hypothetical protein
MAGSALCYKHKEGTAAVTAAPHATVSWMRGADLLWRHRYARPSPASRRRFRNICCGPCTPRRERPPLPLTTD